MSGSGSGGDAALAQQHEAQQQQQPPQQQQLEQPHELSDTDSSEWALPKNVAGGAGAGAAGGSATGTAQQQQTQQVGTIGQQQQPGSGDEANQIYSSATVYAVRSFWGSSVVLVVVWHVRLALWLPWRSTGDVFSPHESVPLRQYPVLPLRRLGRAAALWALSRVAVVHNLGTDCRSWVHSEPVCK